MSESAKRVSQLSQLSESHTEDTDKRTHPASYSPTRDNSPSVTRTRTYGFGWRFCEECDLQQPVVDEFDDQIGYEEQARPVRVVALDCGHDIVTELKR